MPHQTRASAPGKAVLLGEYAVLEGAPALVAAVNRRARVCLTRATGWSLTAEAIGVADAAFVCAPDGSLKFARAREDALPQLNVVRAVLGIVHQTLTAHERLLRPCHMTVDTSEFVAQDGTKLGLGSSAAVSVALVLALLSHNDALDTVLPQNSEARRRALMAIAFDVHARAQGGMGSGVDIAASVHGGVLRFVRNGASAEVTAYAPMPALGSAFTWAGHATSTPEFVSRVRAFKARDAAGYGDLMQRLDSAARAGAQAWEQACVHDFLTAVSAAFAGLAELGKRSGADIVSAPHRDMDRVVATAGGVYKSSGAGGGDLGVAFTQGQNQAQGVARALAAANFSVLPLAFDPQGVHIDACTTSHEDGL